MSRPPDRKWLVTGGEELEDSAYGICRMAGYHASDRQQIKCLVLSPNSDDIAACLATDRIGLLRIDQQAFRGRVKPSTQPATVLSNITASSLVTQR